MIAVQSSTLARIINIEIAAHVNPERLRIATERSDDGTLQLFGGAYLQWLAGRDDILAGGFFKEQWQRVVARLTKALPNVHARLAPTAAGLITVGFVLLAFVKNVYPEREPEIKKWLADGYTAMVASLSQQATELQAITPMATFLSTVVGQMRVGAFHLAHARGASASGPGIFNTIPSDALAAENTRHSTKQVGWYRDADEWRASGNPPHELPADLHGTVYLFSRDSFATFKRLYRDTNHKEPPFDWGGLKRSFAEAGVGFPVRTWTRRALDPSEQMRGHAVAEEDAKRIANEI